MKKIIVIFTFGASFAMLQLNAATIAGNSTDFQEDPAKTPKNPRLKTAGNVDGTGGKYAADHKQDKSDFTKRKHHIKKAKGSEKKSKSRASTSGQNG